MIQQQQLIEWAKYVDNYYGTPKAYVEQQLSEGKNVILEIEIQGALNVKKMFPDALLIFVTPPSAKQLKERLIGRGTEDMATIQKRLKRAAEESEYMNVYDYIAVNDVLEDCVQDLHQTITQAQEAVANGQQFQSHKDFTELIRKIQQELKEI